jgi:hypothetical protein
MVTTLLLLAAFFGGGCAAVLIVALMQMSGDQPKQRQPTLDLDLSPMQW